MDAQAHGAWAQTKLLLKGRAHRIDHIVPPGLYSLDDVRALQDLVAHGRHDGRHQADSVYREFMDIPATPFQPVYTLPVI
jgi:hypothetical protein